MKHNMSLYSEAFDKVRNGRAELEARLFDPKRRRVRIGDTIVFGKLPEKRKKVSVKVLGISRFNSFRDMFSNLDSQKFGHGKGTSVGQQIRRMMRYYTKKEEKKFGVVALHIKLLKR